jgi:hypothetical protein
MRYSVSSSPNKISVIVPRQSNGFHFLVFPLWTAAWVGLVVEACRKSADKLVIPSAVVFGAFTLPLLYQWLWNLNGSESLVFADTSLQYRRILFGLTRRRDFNMSEMSEPYFVERSGKRRSRVPSGLGFGYKGEQIRVGDGLTREEVTEIVRLILDQFPQLRSSRSEA